MRKLEKKNVIEAFKTTGAKELLVTNDGHIFEMRAKSFCDRYCVTTGAKSTALTIDKVDEHFKAIEALEAKAKKRLETKPNATADSNGETKKSDQTSAEPEDKNETSADSSDSRNKEEIKAIEDFLKNEDQVNFSEAKDFLKSLDPRVKLPKSKAEVMEMIKASLDHLKTA